ncbi:hypothetical protein [Tenacibaculum halocynthiae]|uniref:hypothetical protein n=1 Tax=Tenacibaculum halocynthiae TaxID=1254437 RepID=UPI0026292473|nr:hypothetical protein [uncultured Tenacibaculum sp.]
MKKQILILGQALNKADQKQIFGGGKTVTGSNQCYSDSDCCNHKHNSSYGYVCSGYGGVCVPGIFGENPCGL